MFCSKCGQQCDDNATFCKNCGYNLKQGAPLKGGVPNNAARKKRNSNLYIVLVGFAIAVVIAGMLALILWLTGVFDAKSSVVGTWTRSDGSISMEFDDKGFFQIHEESETVTGAYAYDSQTKTATIFYDRDGSPAKKALTLEADTFTLDGAQYQRE